MDRDTELALVERLRQGDADAFDDVYAAFNTRLFTFLVRLSRRRDVAEDLLDETWLQLASGARNAVESTRARCSPRSGAEEDDVMSDPLIRLLAKLPPAEPDRAQAERIRIRCRAQLARQSPRATLPRAVAARVRIAWQPLIAALGVAYLTEAIVQALRLYGIH